jgi:hypothetical protein
VPAGCGRLARLVSLWCVVVTVGELVLLCAYCVWDRMVCRIEGRPWPLPRGDLGRLGCFAGALFCLSFVLHAFSCKVASWWVWCCFGPDVVRVRVAVLLALRQVSGLSHKPSASRHVDWHCCRMCGAAVYSLPACMKQETLTRMAYTVLAVC